MTKPEDIPQDVWDASFAALLPIVRNQYETSPMAMVQHLGIARAILAERERALEEAAAVAEKERRTDLAIKHGYWPTWFVVQKETAAAIRALKGNTMTNKNLIERLKRECDRHVIGYPGPRREVAELIDEAAALIEQQEALLASLSKAATDFLELYLQGVNSGDWGNWNPEKEPEVIAVRTALLSAKTHLGE